MSAESAVVNGRPIYELHARLVRLLEALEDGDASFAYEILADLLREIGDAE